jgi:hypothetical protein
MVAITLGASRHCVGSCLRRLPPLRNHITANRTSARRSAITGNRELDADYRPSTVREATSLSI